MRTALTSADVRALEEPFLAAGVPLMERAARAVADRVETELRRVRKNLTDARVLVLVGPGANGGDGLHAGAMLAAKGVRVVALVLGQKVHPAGLYAARSAGCDVQSAPGSGFTDDPGVDLADLARWPELVVDAATGTGGSGPLRGTALAAVEALRAAPRRPVVAIDVPSGVGVENGTLPGPVLAADVTVTMIAAKPALLLPPAAGVAGRVEVADIGVPATAAPRVLASDRADVTARLRAPTWDDDKYSRGVLGVLAGSSTFPGAGVLTVGAALRTGLGMVRHLAGGRASDLVLAAHPEVVGAAGRVQARVLGPGTDGEADAEAITRELDASREDGVPTVLDAGALDVLPHHLAAADADGVRPPGAHVLTPHAGEAARLLTALGEGEVSRSDVLAAPGPCAERLAGLTGAVVLLKGARTVVAGGGALRVADAAVPWLATAGSGDVLAGVLGALLATARAGAEADGTALEHADLADVAVAAAVLHGTAGHRAAGPAPGRPITASDVVAALPGVVADLLAGRDPADDGPGETAPGLLRRFGLG
ncbi:MAG: NAD(P)H-hydrate epimerase [Actinomycetaceae bacterium]